MDTEASRFSSSDGARLARPTFEPDAAPTSQPPVATWFHDDWTRPFSVHDTEIRCGRFRLLPRCRALLRDGRDIELGGRAFDLLHVLMQSPGALVSKAEIVKQVWPATIVEECNLRFQVAALRKALGNDRDLIKSIRGRGYLFATDLPGGQPSGTATDEADLTEAPEREEPKLSVGLHHDNFDSSDCAVTIGVAETSGVGDGIEDLLRSVLIELRRIRGQAR